MIRTYVKILIDTACVALVGIIVLIFYLVGKPFQRGFYCDDESLKYPYKDDTVPSWSLIIGLVVPAIVIILTEFVLSSKLSKQKANFIYKNRIPIQEWMQKVYTQVGLFLFGAGINQVLTDIAKYTIGRLRPHFFDVCKPDIDCGNPLNLNKYITTYTCRTFDEAKVRNMRLSFPSGHSSIIMYSMVYFSLYMHSRYNWSYSKLLKHILQLIAMGIAVFVALSRISDNKHHWSDVLAGSLLGVTVATITALYISKLFPRIRSGYAPFSMAGTTDVLPETNGAHA